MERLKFDRDVAFLIAIMVAGFAYPISRYLFRGEISGVLGAGFALLMNIALVLWLSPIVRRYVRGEPAPNRKPADRPLRWWWILVVAVALMVIRLIGAFIDMSGWVELPVFVTLLVLLRHCVRQWMKRDRAPRQFAATPRPRRRTKRQAPE